MSGSTGRWSRREWLAGVGAVAACGGTPSAGSALQARASAPPALGPARNLIVLQVYGGWDTLYSVDPKPGSSWMSVPSGSLRTFGNIPLWSSDSRPFSSAFFEAHHERVSVIHGINVRSVDHSQCLRWMLTGTRDPLAPDVCAISASVLGDELPIPFLLLSDRAFLGPFGALASRAGGVNQIAGLLTPGETYAPVDGTVALEPTADETAAIEAFRQARQARPQGTVGSFVMAREDTWGSRERAKVLRSLGDALGSPGTAQDLTAQISTALGILEGGLSRAVMLDAQVFFDTHGDNTLQVKAQEETFAHLSQLFTELESRPGREGGSLFDETVVAIVSEMGRAPTMNEGGGKDHWPFASVLMAGAGIRGNVVLGGTTDDGFLGRKVDLETGVIDDDNGEDIHAERFTAGLLTAVGVDPEDWLPGITPFRGFLS